MFEAVVNLKTKKVESLVQVHNVQPSLSPEDLLRAEVRDYEGFMYTNAQSMGLSMLSIYICMSSLVSAGDYSVRCHGAKEMCKFRVS